MKRQFFSVALSAAILAMTSVGITASAAEITSDEQITSESVITTVAEDNNSSENALTSDIMGTETEIPAEIDIGEFMKYMSQFADTENVTLTDPSDDSRPDYYGDDYYDIRGNATLIKSEQIIYNSEEMQFIAVTTKDGNVFYVLINYSAANGEDNVYFLNKVDAIDLYSLIYMTDEEEKSGIDMTNVSKAEEDAQKALGNATSSESKSDNADTTESDDTAEQGQPAKQPMSSNSLYLIIGVVAVLGIGGAGFFILKKKPAKKASPETEDDEKINFYDDEEINEDEE